MASQLSFLPDDYLERKAQRRSNVVCAVLFIVVMSVIGTGFWMSEKATKEVDGEYKKIEEQYVGAAQRLKQFKEIQDKQQRMAHQAEITSSLVERIQRNFILAEFTNALQPGISLMELSLESKPRTKVAEKVEAKTIYEQKKQAKQAALEAAAAAKHAPEPKKYDVYVKLTGLAKNDSQVADYLTRLSNSHLLKDVNLVSTEEYAVEREKTASSSLPASPADKDSPRGRQKEAEKEIWRKFQIDMMLSPDAEVTAQDVARVTAAAVAGVEMAPEK